MRNRWLGVSLLGCALGAAAQTEVRPMSEAQRLACLSKPADPPRYPQQHQFDREQGSMRLMLKFSKPDAPPTVEVLFNSARKDMQDLAHAYVAAYRLPCLRAEDGVVSAVQDFDFRNHDRDPTPLPIDIDDKLPLCLVMPREEFSHTISHLSRRARAEHIVAELVFRGDGNQPPEVEFRYTRASGSFEVSARDWLSKYRMPCRQAGDPPRHILQTLSMHPEGKRRYGLTQERFGLIEFLRMTREPEKLRVRFDLTTMACPFKLTYTVGNEQYPSLATVEGPANPNQQGFLAWLSSLQLAFPSRDTANDVFGSALQVDVPCGLLYLGEEPPAPN